MHKTLYSLRPTHEFNSYCCMFLSHRCIYSCRAAHKNRYCGNCLLRLSPQEAIEAMLSGQTANSSTLSLDDPQNALMISRLGKLVMESEKLDEEENADDNAPKRYVFWSYCIFQDLWRSCNIFSGWNSWSHCYIWHYDMKLFWCLYMLVCLRVCEGETRDVTHSKFSSLLIVPTLGVSRRTTGSRRPSTILAVVLQCGSASASRRAWGHNIPLVCIAYRWSPTEIGRETRNKH